MAAYSVTQAKQVDNVGSGSYTVAPNLILRVKPTGARSWVFRYQSYGKVKELGLGAAGNKERGLAEARNGTIKSADATKLAYLLNMLANLMVDSDLEKRVNAALGESKGK